MEFNRMKLHHMKNIILGLLIICSIKIQAQQDAQYTHYMFNTLAVNPGYAGSRDMLTVTALHRNQWLNFPGAPVTQTLTLHTPIFSKNIGVGLSLINDKIGPDRTQSAYGDFSYKIRIGEQSKLAFGLKGGINIRTNDLVTLKTDQENDPNLLSNSRSDLVPNFGFGLYYSQNKDSF